MQSINRFLINYCVYLTRGSSHCAAIYQANIIYSPINNDVLIKYLPKTSNQIPPISPISSSSVIKTFYQLSPSWRRYTFLSHLTTKLKIYARWIKKLVAATYGVSVLSQKNPINIFSQIVLSKSDLSVLIIFIF